MALSKGEEGHRQTNKRFGKEHHLPERCDEGLRQNDPAMSQKRQKGGFWSVATEQQESDTGLGHGYKRLIPFGGKKLLWDDTEFYFY